MAEEEELKLRIVSSLPDKVYSLLGSSPDGLDRNETTKRLESYGLNEIAQASKIPIYQKFVSQFTHFFAILLWIATILSFIAKMPELAWAILAVIIINGIFSFWQEYKAEKATEALRKLLPYTVKVIRNRELVEVDARYIVPGDVVLLSEGDRIPADIRLVESFELQVDNSVLTGESRPVRKTAGVYTKTDVNWIDLPNICFAGTNVVSGNGKGLVFNTGMKTEFGKIARLTLVITAELSPLQKEMIFVTRVVAVIAISMGILFYLLGTCFAGLSQLHGFIFAIGIIVANVPEGLLPTVTLSLAMAVQRMARKNSLVKKLSSVETLGSCTVICSDKTGTLTQNEMTVRKIWMYEEFEVTGVGYRPEGEFVKDGKILSNEDLEKSHFWYLLTSAICNNSKIVSEERNKRWRIIGDPTEGSLLVMSLKSKFVADELRKWKRVRELPFDSRRKRMTVISQKGDDIVAFVKGAADEILERCSSYYKYGEISPMSEEAESAIKKANEKYAREAYRVLALAYRPFSNDVNLFKLEIDEVENDLIFLGLAAMIDPPRPEVEEAVKKCNTAGIKIIMITGDHGLTAEAIAKKVGMIKGKAKIVTGNELDKMDEPVLNTILKEKNVLFARIAPEHKLRIVSNLKEMGEIVAVTGDGVNDAPALKKSDIGVAMGIVGTDVAKEAADMVLLDDNFATIVNAIEEGRAVFDNIRRFVGYIFTSNIPEIVPYLAFVLSGGAIPLPMTVLQILAVDLGTDLVPALALGTELPEKGVMERPPRPRKERLLNASLLLRAYGFLGIIEAAACMGGFFFAYWQTGWRLGQKLISSGPLYERARTMCLAGVVTTQIGNGYAWRSHKESIFKKGFLTNHFYLFGIFSELILIGVFVYTPFFKGLFGHRPLGIVDWAFLFAWTPVILLAEETRKFIIRRRTSHEGGQR